MSLAVLCAAGAILGCADEDENPATTAIRDNQAPPIVVSSSGGIQIGRPLPSFDAFTLAGGRWNGEFEAKATLVNVWATWCSPCRYEIPDLIRLRNDWGPAGFDVLGVSVDNPGTGPMIQQFAKDFGINYPIIHDAAQTTLDALRTSVVPTTVLVDHEGIVLWMHLGPVSAEDQELLEILRQQLGSRPETSEEIRL